MKVLIISSDLRISIPAGAVYIAGAARNAGHIVEVFDSYLAGDLSNELVRKLAEFKPDIVGFLNLDYGIRGEGEYAFSLFLKYFEQGDDITSVPGAFFRKDDEFHKVARDRIKDLDDTAYPAYDLIDIDAYTQRNIPVALFTKRGCPFAYYISPELPKTYMLDLIESLQNKEKYRLQVNKPYAGYKKQVNAIR